MGSRLGVARRELVSSLPLWLSVWRGTHRRLICRRNLQGLGVLPIGGWLGECCFRFQFPWSFPIGDDGVSGEFLTCCWEGGSFDNSWGKGNGTADSDDRVIVVDSVSLSELWMDNPAGHGELLVPH